MISSSSTNHILLDGIIRLFHQGLEVTPFCNRGLDHSANSPLVGHSGVAKVADHQAKMGASYESYANDH